MKRFILFLLAMTSLACFATGILYNNIIFFACSITLALAAYLADRRYQAYFDLSELRK